MIVNRKKWYVFFSNYLFELSSCSHAYRKTPCSFKNAKHNTHSVIHLSPISNISLSWTRQPLSLAFKIRGCLKSLSIYLENFVIASISIPQYLFVFPTLFSVMTDQKHPIQSITVAYVPRKVFYLHSLVYTYSYWHKRR